MVSFKQLQVLLNLTVKYLDFFLLPGNHKLHLTYRVDLKDMKVFLHSLSAIHCVQLTCLFRHACTIVSFAFDVAFICICIHHFCARNHSHKYSLHPAFMLHVPAWALPLKPYSQILLTLDVPHHSSEGNHKLSCSESSTLIPLSAKLYDR